VFKTLILDTAVATVAVCRHMHNDGTTLDNGDSLKIEPVSHTAHAANDFNILRRSVAVQLQGTISGGGCKHASSLSEAHACHVCAVVVKGFHDAPCL